MDLIFLVRHKKRSVEHVMNLPHLWEAELICDGGEDLDNGEGSFSFEGQLGVGNGAFEVSGF